MKDFKIKEVFIESSRDVKRNLFEHVLVSVVSQSLALLLISQIAQRFFDLALLSARVDGITNENMFKVMLNPLTLSLVFLTVLLSAMFIVMQLSINMAFANKPYTQEVYH